MKRIAVLIGLLCMTASANVVNSPDYLTFHASHAKDTVYFLTWDVGTPETSVLRAEEDPYTGKIIELRDKFQKTKSKYFVDGKEAADFIRRAPDGVSNFRLYKQTMPSGWWLTEN